MIITVYSYAYLPGLFGHVTDITANWNTSRTDGLAETAIFGHFAYETEFSRRVLFQNTQVHFGTLSDVLRKLAYFVVQE